MTFITDLADQAVILPLVLAVCVASLSQGWRRDAAIWALGVFVTFAVVVMLKLTFLACSASFGTPNIRTPSGHVAAATVVTGGLAGLLLRRRTVAVLFAAFAAVVIGASRLALGLHSFAEVVLGAAVGLAGAFGMLLLIERRPSGLDAGRIVVIAVLVAVLFHGLHLPVEAQIRFAAWKISRVLAVCQSDDVRL